jgi:hypothetical protein
LLSNKGRWPEPPRRPRTWNDRIGHGDVPDMNFGDHVLRYSR